MTDIPPLSVIIPHLNDPEGLAQCLTVLDRERGDVPGLEVIVVDNGSKELPTALVAAHGAILLEEATPGPGPARTTGAKAARAPYLAFIDSDCFAEPGWAKAILAHHAKPDGTPVIGGDVSIAWRKPGEPDMIEAFEAVYNYRQRMYIEEQNFSGTGNLSMPAEVFADVGGFAGINVAEDRDWGQRAAAKGYEVSFVEGMSVTTPAREDFASAFKRIDRMVAHDFTTLPKTMKSKIMWFIKGSAMLASPIWETLRIARSTRISGLKTKLLSLIGLTRIRWYRGGQMLRLFFLPNARPKSEAWSRD